jgi:hypothetical protein
VDRKDFFAQYAQIMYGQAVAADVAAGLAAADRSENELALAFSGRHPGGDNTSPLFWEDPLTPEHLTRASAQLEHFRQCRLRAEDAQEHLSKALRLGADPSSLSDLLLEVRILDYAGMKNVYAAELAGFWKDMGPHPDRRKLGFYVSTESISHDHSRIQDLLDYSGDIQQAYRTAWLNSYTPYRLGTVMGRWTAEFLYWWNLDNRFRDLVRRFRPGDTLPPLDSFSQESGERKNAVPVQ